jgi:hypothetical protein
MRYLRFLIIGLIVIFSSSAIAGSYSKSMLPTASERLDDPISLVGVCEGVEVIEWRATAGYKKQTGLSEDKIKIVKNVCKLAVNKFPEFAKKRGYKLTNSDKFETKVCVMPAKMELDGDSPRNLNDINYRFSERSDKDPLWGYYHRYKNYVFVRNDVKLDNGKTNHHFKTVFAHELFHAMSYRYGMYNKHPGNRDRVDEVMAQQFTVYIGLGM